MDSRKARVQLRKALAIAATVQSIGVFPHRSLSLLDKLLVRELVALAEIEGEDIDFGALIPMAIKRIVVHAGLLDNDQSVKCFRTLTTLYTEELKEFLFMPPRVAFSRMMEKRRWRKAFTSIAKSCFEELMS
jgi:hypothetical protein